jgi:AcrR family transcriptional regulator
MARAVRTRRAVVDAMLSLLEEGDLRPTSKTIAARAGVSERTIFQHFSDLEQLFSLVTERVGERIGAQARRVAIDGAFETRLAGFVHEIAFLNEAMTPVRRASRLHEPDSPVLQHSLRGVRTTRRRVAKQVFARELEAFGSREERERALHAATLLSLWSSWENMRVHLGLDRAEARRTLAQGLRSVLGQPTPEILPEDDARDERLGDEIE